MINRHDRQWRSSRVQRGRPWFSCGPILAVSRREERSFWCAWAGREGTSLRGYRMQPLQEVRRNQDRRPLTKFLKKVATQRKVATKAR